jgi:hypothetical protein
MQTNETNKGKYSKTHIFYIKKKKQEKENRE